MSYSIFQNTFDTLIKGHEIDMKVKLLSECSKKVCEYADIFCKGIFIQDWGVKGYLLICAT